MLLPVLAVFVVGERLVGLGESIEGLLVAAAVRMRVERQTAVLLADLGHGRAAVQLQDDERIVFDVVRLDGDHAADEHGHEQPGDEQDENAEVKFGRNQVGNVPKRGP